MVSALLLAFLWSGTAAAVGPPAGPFAAPMAGAAMSPAQRGQAAKQFVLRWAPYVEQTYGVDMRTWAMRMAPTLRRRP